jgi:preprotein translocase subunit SecE
MKVLGRSMARKQGGPPPKQNKRPAVPAKAVVVAAPVRKTAAPDAPKPGLNPVTWFMNLPKFSNEVRAEARKVTWTSRQETWITSVMVFMMVVITAVFFLIVDQVLGFSMHQLLKLVT